MFYDFMYMVGFGSGSVQFDRIWIRPKGFERIRIRNTAYSPIKSMLSSVSREESGPSCSKKRAAVGCQEEPTKRACYRVSKKQSWARNNYLAVRCDNVIQPQGPEKNKYNKYTKMAITNNFVALKHGHIVETELSRAQL